MTRRTYSPGYYRAHVNPPSSPPQEPHCGSCWKTNAYLARTGAAEGCAYIGCPKRRAMTAAPAQRPEYPIQDDTE